MKGTLGGLDFFWPILMESFGAAAPSILKSKRCASSFVDSAALACELYLARGIRSCEIGSVMFGKHETGGGFHPARLELVRLALPRRVYTQSHVDRILEICAEVARRAEDLCGMEMTYAPPFLPHFTARFRPLARPAPVGSGL